MEAQQVCISADRTWFHAITFSIDNLYNFCLLENNHQMARCAFKK